MQLQQIGADARVRELFGQNAVEGLELARVSSAAHEQYQLYLEDGECEGAPSGKLRWSEGLPAVGDWVAVRRVDRALALIEAVLPRRTQFSRRAAGKATAEQVIATNVDLVLIVCGLDGDFNLRRIERYLVLVRESGAEAVVVLNKADLCGALPERIASVERIAAGAPVLAMSAHRSIKDLSPFTRDRTVAFLGSSGVGKSTIVNALLGGEVQPTAAVREHDSRGRHTTTSRMLIPLPGGGALIDNPGMRELQLWASEDSLEEVFGDVAALAVQCRFGDCSHTDEPGCAVQVALENGELDQSRWASYQKLQAELRHTARQEDSSLMLAEKKKWKIIHKAMRHHPKYRR